MEIETSVALQQVDDGLRAVARAYPDKPIRIRIQPDLYTPTPDKKRNGMYLAWRGVYWNLKCDTVEDAQGVRLVIGKALELLAQYGTENVLTALDTVAGPR